jgi:prolyl-tRNA editing enzyme YbaK/EbsC (Cys-tRNA(Pro) deacylase)
LLGCTEEQLTKVIIVENKVTDAVDCSDPHNSLYYMVVVQYVARLSDVMLRKVVSELKPLEQRLTKKKFNLQVAPEDVVLKLIGFAHNGVCPLGGKVRIPVIVDSAVRDVEKGFIWMGGGVRSSNTKLT